jgi:two-component system chemotaxis response regulator CheY
MQDNVPSGMRHILIIDDDQLTALALMRTLKAEDRNILAVAKGPQALSELRARHYDLVFLEISTFDRSGMVVLEEIRQSASSTCVVVMSADILDEEMEKTVIDHNHFFLPKPFEVLQVRTLASKILAIEREPEPGANRIDKGGEERRQWPRSRHSGQVVCAPDQEECGSIFPENFKAEVTDVSRGGVGLRTDHPVPPGQRISFCGETAVWEGIVRWSFVFGNRFRAGVEFV